MEKVGDYLGGRNRIGHCRHGKGISRKREGARVRLEKRGKKRRAIKLQHGGKKKKGVRNFFRFGRGLRDKFRGKKIAYLEKGERGGGG